MEVTSGAAGQPPRDTALEDAFRRGDAEAVRQVYERFGGMILRVGRLALQHQQDAEDLVQQVLLRAWRGRSGFDPLRGSLRTWLLAICRRQIADTFGTRTRGRRDLLAAAAVADRDVVPPVDQQIVERLAAGTILERLSDEQQVVLRLAYYDGLTHLEIAEATGTPLGTIKSHLRRGLSRLRQEWEVEDATP